MTKSFSTIARLLALLAVAGAVLVSGPGALAGQTRASELAATPVDTDTSGTVTAIDGGSISIRSKKGKVKTFRLRPDTTFERLDDDARLDDVKVGMVVKVEFATAPDGKLDATAVTIGVATRAGWFFSTRVEGIVSAATADGLEVKKESGKVVAVRYGPQTTFARIATTLTAASMRTGDLAYVKYDIGADGTLTATSVEVGVKTPAGVVVYTDKHKGSVVEIGGGSVTLDLKGYPATSFPITQATKIERLGSAAKLAAIRTGDVVKVVLAQTPTGSLFVEKLNAGAKTPFGDLFSTREEGRIAALSPTRLQLTTPSGDILAFRLGAKTEFRARGLLVKRSTFRRGNVVKVGFAVAGSVLRAEKVTLGTVRGGKLVFPKKVKGTVVRIAGSRLVVRKSSGKTSTILLSSRTVYQRLGRPATRAKIRPGDLVKVTYDPLRANRKLALVVSEEKR